MDATQTEIAVREINRFIPEIVDMAKLIGRRQLWLTKRTIPSTIAFM